MPPIIFFLLAILFATFAIRRKKTKNREKIVEIFLSYLLLFNVGLMGLLAFVSHIFYPDATAKAIGWGTGSPFQFEIGMANLALGVAGVLCFWLRGSFWFATILITSILFIGCFVGHLIEYQKGNTAPYNIGPLVWIGDLFIPLLLVILYGFLARLQRVK